MSDAFAEMETAPIKPSHTDNGDVSYGLMGYSQGGGVIHQLASNYDRYGLPAPRALFYVCAAGGGNVGNLPEDTKVFLLAADNDMDAILPAMESVWNGISHIPYSNRNFVMAMSDSRGSTTCSADHSMCLTGQSENSFMLNALDFYGVWKFSTAIMNFAFKGTDAKYCTGTGTDVTYMGEWSDGEPFKPAQIMDSLVVTSIGDNIPIAAKTFSEVAVLAGKSGIRIESETCALRDIAVFDIRGRLVAHYDNILAKIATIAAGPERYQTVCLRIRLTDNTVTVRKIFGGR